MKRVARKNPHRLSRFQQVLWIGCLCFTGYGCRCSDDAVLAVTEEVTGAVERDFAASQNQWKKADVGAEFRVGDGIQSKAAAAAVLALGDGSFARLAENTRIRFYALTEKGKKNSKKLEVETGELELTVGDDDFTLQTPQGVAVIKSGSKVRIQRTEAGTDFAVDIGKATFVDRNARSVEIGPGQRIDLEIGAAVIEPTVPPSADTDQAPKPDTEAAAEAETEVEVEVETPDEEAASRHTDRSDGDHNIQIAAVAEKPDFAASLGESFTVHAPMPPTTVALLVGDKCPNEAAVKVGNKWAGRGQGAVTILLKAGSHRYRAVCLDENRQPAEKDVARGRITVRADAGRKRIPNAAPSSFVEVDGRSYNILYQTRLPNVTVRWPDAPPGQTYALSITSSGKTRKVSSKTPEIRLASGELDEGVHKLRFQATGSLSRTSRTSEVKIRYDNAAPTAGITAPSEGGFGPGESVEVRGEAAPGWSVSLSDGTISLDPQNRFTGQATFSGTYRAIAIRLHKSGRGVHYYLRRGRAQ